MTAHDTSSSLRTTPASWSFTGESGAQGFVSQLGEGPVHWVRWGSTGAADADPLLLVHGLGGSHLNWNLVAPEWAKDRAVFAVDLRGFGMSPGFPQPTSVLSNRDLVIDVIEQVIGRPVVLVGNSMGGLISTLVSQRRPDLVRATVLIDPALPLVAAKPDPLVAAQFGLFAIPGVAERAMRRNRLRVSPEVLATQLMRLCFADPTRMDPAMHKEAVALATARAADPHQGNLERGFTAAARSLLLLLGRPRRYRRLLAELKPPILLIQGDQDRLVHVAAARRVARDNPHWRYVELAGVGHTPQLEVPDVTSRIVSEWFTDVLASESSP
ncbi:MAG: alpha/beta hydrolase [Knoellia sp.]